jgi:hypothetical protein
METKESLNPYCYQEFRNGCCCVFVKRISDRDAGPRLCWRLDLRMQPAAGGLIQPCSASFHIQIQADANFYHDKTTFPVLLPTSKDSAVVFDVSPCVWGPGLQIWYA